jgi:prepilin signal peptidase PulO-like enzyme (type II secretory pathway)
MTGRLFACRRRQAALAGVLAAGIAFAVATLAHRGLSGDGVAWGLVQLTLAGVAAYDLATRRIRNLVTLPGSLLAILLRAAFERGALVEVLLAGFVVFLAFFALALLLRSGFGMGDAKFAGMLGFVLGSAVVPALLIGTVAGGVMGAGVLARSRTRGATIAYGPYLAFGAAVAILVFSTPPLV